MVEKLFSPRDELISFRYDPDGEQGYTRDSADCEQKDNLPNAKHAHGFNKAYRVKDEEYPRQNVQKAEALVRLRFAYAFAARSISSLIVHTWSVSLLAIAGVVPFSASCFRAKLYHATNKACIAVW